MRFWPNFFGSLHNPNVYANARLVYAGWGIRYSVQLLLLEGLLSLTFLLATTRFTAPTLRDVESLLVIFGLMLALRVAMLGPLVIAARLIGYAMKLHITNAQAARITALAYTPVALADAAAYFASGFMLSPPLLFGLGVLMLLAAVHAAK